MIKIVFTYRAKDDLKEIKEYIETQLLEPKTANKLIYKILKKIDQLSIFPESGPKLEYFDGTYGSYRYIICENYIIFYQHDGENVYIYRILYQRRDYKKILFNENNK